MYKNKKTSTQVAKEAARRQAYLEKLRGKGFTDVTDWQKRRPEVCYVPYPYMQQPQQPFLFQQSIPCPQGYPYPQQPYHPGYQYPPVQHQQYGGPQQPQQYSQQV